jgi:hypothetical protein
MGNLRQGGLRVEGKTLKSLDDKKGEKSRKSDWLTCSMHIEVLTFEAASRAIAYDHDSYPI